jgi:hypothetical protein
MPGIADDPRLANVMKQLGQFRQVLKYTVQPVDRGGYVFTLTCFVGGCGRYN